MAKSAEAIIEMVAQGWEEVEKAFSKTGKAMNDIGKGAEEVNSRMSVLGRGLELARDNMSKLTVAAASFGAIAYSLNKIQKEYAEGAAALEYAVERQGVNFTEVESQLNGLLTAYSVATGMSLPQLQRAVADITPILRDSGAAFDVVKVAADLAKARGGDFEGAMRDIIAILSGDEGTILKFQELGYEVDVTMSGLENIAAIAPVVKGAAEDMATGFDKLKNQFMLVTEKAADFNEALGGVPLMALGVVAAAVGIVAAIAVLANPIGLIVLGVTGLIAVIMLLWKNWDQVWGWIKDKVSAIWEAIKTGPLAALQVFLGPTGKILAALLITRKTWGEIWDGIKDKVGAVIDWLKGGPFQWLLNFLGPVGIIISTLTGMSTKWAGIWDGIKKTVSTIWDGIRAIFGGFISFVTGIFTGNWSKAWDGILSVFRGFKDLFLGYWDAIWSGIKSFVNLIIDSLNLLIRGINSIPNVTLPSFLGGSEIGLPDIPEIPHLAHGTESFRGGAAIVGENGPELVSLPRGSQVTPMAGTQRLTIILDGRVLAEAVIDRWVSEVRLQGV